MIVVESAGPVEYPGLLLCRGVSFPNACPGYDTTQSKCEVPVMLEIWEMRSNPSLQSFSGLLCPGVEASDRLLSMGQIELSCVLLLN